MKTSKISFLLTFFKVLYCYIFQWIVYYMQVVASVADPIWTPVMKSVMKIFGVKIVKSSNHISSQTVSQIELKLDGRHRGKMENQNC